MTPIMEDRRGHVGLRSRHARRVDRPRARARSRSTRSTPTSSRAAPARARSPASSPPGASGHGLEASVDEIAPGRWNVVGVARGSGGGKTLLLNAHMDTVGHAGMDAPLEPRVEGGRLYGRGAYDMKASLAALLLAGARAKRARPARRRRRDRGRGRGGREHRHGGRVAAAVTADAAIVTEPTEERVALAHRGFVWLEVETIGRRGARIAAPPRRSTRSPRWATSSSGSRSSTARSVPIRRTTLLGSGSLHASLVEGGRRAVDLPRPLRARRPSAERSRASRPRRSRREVQAIVDRAAASDPDLRAEVRTTFVREPFEVDRDEAVVESVRRPRRRDTRTRARGRRRPVLGGRGDLQRRRNPDGLFGPVGEGAHADVEWVDLESAARCAETYLAVAAELCA